MLVSMWGQRYFQQNETRFVCHGHLEELEYSTFIPKIFTNDILHRLVPHTIVIIEKHAGIYGHIGF